MADFTVYVSNVCIFTMQKFTQVYQHNIFQMEVSLLAHYFVCNACVTTYSFLVYINQF